MAVPRAKENPVPAADAADAADAARRRIAIIAEPISVAWFA
jgi:hypothetical protein